MTWPTEQAREALSDAQIAHDSFLTIPDEGVVCACGEQITASAEAYAVVKWMEHRDSAILAALAPFVAAREAQARTDAADRGRLLATLARVEALAEDFDANGNSRALEDTSAHAWYKAAGLLRAALADRPTDG